MKETLRRQLLDKRTSLPSKDIAEKSRVIQNRLFSFPGFMKAKTVLFYVSYDNEVCTHEMIKQTVASGKQVAVPWTDKEQKMVTPCLLSCWDDLCIGSYGILEPKTTCRKPVLLEHVDVVIVPGVGFDRQGHRLGHGMGYYDKLLHQAPKNMVKIGLAFEQQMVDKIPVDTHDVRVAYIVTEHELIDCRG